MPMLKQHASQKVISSTVLFSVVAATMGASAILIMAASRLSGAAGTAVETAGLGPLNLFEIHRTSLQNGGVQASVRLASGFAGYLIIWLLIAALVVMVRLKMSDE